ncbi:MAG: glycogen-binding domain-containing protein [Nannocystales bacterium]
MTSQSRKKRSAESEPAGARGTVDDATTRFTFLAPQAKEVLLAGSFNEWTLSATPMLRGDDGVWTVRVPLAPGRHEYKFVVDGTWCCEPPGQEPHADATERVANEFGTMNRVLHVGP